MLGYTQTGDSGVRHSNALSKYHVLRRLGSGGMAEIYLARSIGIEGFEKHVVLKRILPEHSRNPAFVRMFLDEARLAAKLQHQNIAQVYDIGRIQDGYFFVMEYLHGRDLRSIKREHRKRGARLPIHHALTVAAGAAAGLDYAHNAKDKHGKPLGLVHRDVSPSNIVVTFDGAVKLVDFGIARASDKPSETRSGALKGKVPYMSPEQCRGHDLDARSDLFSLGVTLYELSTGISPFCRKGDTDYLVLERICSGTYEKPTTLVTGFPPRLERIIDKALAINRDDRYQSAREMLRDIEETAAELGVPLSATALADHMAAIYGQQPVPWADDAPAPAAEEQDELLLSTIATGSVVEGVTLFEITPYSEGGGAGVLIESQPDVRMRRPMLWIALSALVAIGGIALAVSALLSDRGAKASDSQEVDDSAEQALPAAAKPVDKAPEPPPPKAEEPKPELAPAAAEPAPAVVKSDVVAAEPKTKKRSKKKRRGSRTAATKVEKKPEPKEATKSGPELPEPKIKKPEKKSGKGLLDRDW